MDTRWLIVADDLTGAADSAIAFAKRRLPSRVTWGTPRIEDRDESVALAFDADTRQSSAAVAARRHQEIVQRLLEPGIAVFKKMDSTLRGHPADELGALIRVLAGRDPRLRVVLAPAFPAGGRVTRGGRVFVHGVPLESTEFWDPARPASRGDLVALLASAGLRARHLAVETVRGDIERLRSAFDEARNGGAVSVCDAEEGADLDRIAAAALDGVPTLFAGSAGLAHSLAAHAARAPGARVERFEQGKSNRGALLVVGSQAGPSRAALAQLADVGDVTRVSPAAERLLAANTDDVLPLAELANALDAGSDVLVDVAPPVGGMRSVVPRVVDALASRIAPLAAKASALMATGGDTAAALLSHVGVRGIRLVDELEPGTSLGLTLGAVTLPIITKSGGFGDAGSLRRILERLRYIRKTGTVA